MDDRFTTGGADQAPAGTDDSDGDGAQFGPFVQQVMQGLRTLRPEEIAALQGAFTPAVLDVLRRLVGPELEGVFEMVAQMPGRPASPQQPQPQMTQPMPPGPAASARPAPPQRPSAIMGVNA